MKQKEDSPQEVLESILLLLAEVGEAVVREARLAQSGESSRLPEASNPIGESVKEDDDLPESLVDQFEPRVVRFR